MNYSPFVHSLHILLKSMDTIPCFCQTPSGHPTERYIATHTHTRTHTHTCTRTHAHEHTHTHTNTYTHTCTRTHTHTCTLDLPISCSVHTSRTYQVVHPIRERAASAMSVKSLIENTGGHTGICLVPLSHKGCSQAVALGINCLSIPFSFKLQHTHTHHNSITASQHHKSATCCTSG